MTVFSNNCSIRPRAKISDCFYSAGMLGYHYLSTDDNCNLGGSPNATAFGWTERTIGPEYTVVVHRYDSGNARKTTIGPNPGGFTHAGDMGYIPGGGAAPFVCSEGATQQGQSCNDGTNDYCTQTCSGNSWQEYCNCGGGGSGSNDGGGDGGN
ncbi:MAG: hypothetical protein EOP11_25905 [Proteobacteria bacterium]|nr:MAG: hypothetical protein EOP11_25905 [Pseudomonadota bacterium]